jgi:cytochrome P450
VLDELNQRMFQPWRALYPSAFAHKRRIAELNGIVRTLIAERRAGRARAAAKDTASTDGAGAAPVSPRSPRAAGTGSVMQAVADSDGTDLAAGSGSGTSLSGKPIFAGGGDMLDMMLDSGLDLTDAQLADEVKTQLLAGHETSSMMLTWACYLLAAHPDAMAKAVREVDEKLGLDAGVCDSLVPGAAAKTPGFDDFKNCEYLGWVLKEAMRVFTPVPVLNRESTQEDVLGGFKIPPKTAIMVSVWALHMSKDIWGPDAESFRPERFSAEESRTRHPFAYLPFSQGPRNCIGQNLAIMEAKVVLGTLLRRFKLAMTPGQPKPVTDSYVIPVRPRMGLHMTVTPRARSSLQAATATA